MACMCLAGANLRLVVNVLGVGLVGAEGYERVPPLSQTNAGTPVRFGKGLPGLKYVTGGANLLRKREFMPTHLFAFAQSEREERYENFSGEKYRENQGKKRSIERQKVENDPIQEERERKTEREVGEMEGKVVIFSVENVKPDCLVIGS